jgi:hypothetical protein
LALAPSLITTPVTTRIVAVAWTAAAAGECVGCCGEEVAREVAASRTISATNARRRKW